MVPHPTLYGLPAWLVRLVALQVLLGSGVQCSGGLSIILFCILILHFILSLITMNALLGSEIISEINPILFSALSCNIFGNFLLVQDDTGRDEDVGKTRKKWKNSFFL